MDRAKYVPSRVILLISKGRYLFRNYTNSMQCAPISTISHLEVGKKVTVGRPLSRLSAYLLDHHRRPVPGGVVGEIYLSGQQMIAGYRNLPEQTKRAFIPNPFSKGATMYKTGDLGYLDESGEIVHVGRADNQVKVRGFRIELEEIDRALGKSDSHVRDAATIVVDKRRIVSFVTPSTVDTLSLRDKVKVLLPAYACPAQVISIAELPKSANAKIDRNALLQHVADVEDVGELPSTPTEIVIAQVWATLLGFKDGEKQIYKEDDFLGIGGNSILAINASRMISESIGHHVPVPVLIRETVLSRLALAIDELSATEEKRIDEDSFKYYSSSLPEDSNPSAASPVTSLEAELYLWHALSQTKSVLNTAFQFSLEGDLDLEKLLAAFHAVIKEEPILRAHYLYNPDSRSLTRTISEHVVAPMVFRDNEMNMTELQSIVDKPFDLAHDQLIRIIIWEKEEETSITLITHHIITDKASLAILLKSVSEKYSAELHSSTQRKPNYLDWSNWLSQGKNITAKTVAKEEFWKKYLSGLKQERMSDWAFVGDESPSYKSFKIPKATSGQGSLKIAVAAVALSLYSVFGQEDVVCAVPVTGRDEPGSEKLQGLFLDRVPVRLDLNKMALSQSGHLLDQVTANINSAVENQLPYWQILDTLKEHRSVFDVMIVYHWQSDDLERSFTLPSVNVKSKPIRARGAKFPLQVEFTETNLGLTVGLEYNEKLLSAAQLAKIEFTLSAAMQGLMNQSSPLEILASVKQNQVKHFKKMLNLRSLGFYRTPEESTS